MSTALLAQDLLSKVGNIAALATSVGLAVGGRDPDPVMSKVSLPAAWVISSDDVNRDSDNDSLIPSMLTQKRTFVVMLIIPYIGQADLITNQYPTLDAVKKVIHGTSSPSGHRWRFVSQRLTQINTDRLQYEQSYSVTEAS